MKVRGAFRNCPRNEPLTLKGAESAPQCFTCDILNLCGAGWRSPTFFGDWVIHRNGERYDFELRRHQGVLPLDNSLVVLHSCPWNDSDARGGGTEWQYV